MPKQRQRQQQQRLQPYTRFDQSERHVPPATIRTPEPSLRLSGQSLILFRHLLVTLEPARITQHHTRLYLLEYIFLCLPNLSLASVPFLLWERWRVTTGRSYFVTYPGILSACESAYGAIVWLYERPVREQMLTNTITPTLLLRTRI